MNKKQLLLGAFLTVAAAATVRAELIQNPGLDAGRTGWSANGGGNGYFYTFNTANPDNEVNNIASLGWWNGVAMWQDTGAAIRPDTDYILTARVRTGDGAGAGASLSFQDVTTGWTWVANQNFLFPLVDKGQNPGPWHTYELDIPASALIGRVGDTIGVGVALITDPSFGEYGWLHVDQVNLQAVPEPTTLVPLTVAVVGVVAFLRHRRQRA
jgi:hypothetical protein